MKFSTGLIIGVGVGYVLGMRASDEKLERMTDTYNRIRTDERVGAVIDKAAEVTEAPRLRTRRIISDQLRNASGVIRDRSA